MFLPNTVSLTLLKHSFSVAEDGHTKAYDDGVAQTVVCKLWYNWEVRRSWGPYLQKNEDEIENGILGGWGSL